MALPRLLLIDDEPALAAFVAKAADLCGYDPVIAERDSEFRERFRSHRPQLIISGFDRRVLDSAYRLGEALGLNMVGPLEKPARLEELEDILNQVRPSLVP
jgi:hypothetical protein